MRSTPALDSSSEPLAILPGLICDSRMFSAQMAEFPGALVVDGFYDGCRSIGDMAIYALERLPERVTLMGHSMGARVALEALKLAPDRVARLVLSSTGIHPVGPGERAGRLSLRDKGRKEGFEKLVDAWLPPMLADPDAKDSDTYKALHAMCVAAGQNRFEDQIEALLTRPSLSNFVGSIQCPTLVLAGELDRWSPVSQHVEIAQAIPGAVCRVIPGAGHMLPPEAPDAFNACLSAWLAEAA